MELLNELESMATIVQGNEAQQFEDLFNDHHPSPGYKEDPQEELSRSTYLLKLEGPLSDIFQVQKLAGLVHAPSGIEGTDAGARKVYFCSINGMTKRVITRALKGLSFTPTFIRINMAEKALSTCSRAPCLGYEATLPHQRADNEAQVFLPTQNQYPVWYFFYGTLSDPEFLAKKLGLPEAPQLIPSTVRCAKLQTWGGKYKALVDGSEPESVKGWAYEITSEEQEEQLRYYETDQYEVVRCDIFIDESGEVLQGLTFRFR